MIQQALPRSNSTGPFENKLTLSYSPGSLDKKPLSTTQVVTHSLASFHDAFHLFCKDEFPVESLFEDCYDEFEKQVQQEVVHSSVCKNENYVVEEELLDTINYEDCMVVDASSLVSDALVPLICMKKQLQKKSLLKIFKRLPTICSHM